MKTYTKDEQIKTPMGTLATDELRKSRRLAYNEFDRIWSGTSMSIEESWTGMSDRRNRAYIWLSKKLGISRHDCHIGMFDIDTCRKVVKICEKQGM